MSILLFKEPRCVFIRIRKTGSTSIVKGLFGGICNAEVRQIDGEYDEKWDELFSFAFVRNPYDRLISAYTMFQTYKIGTAEEKSLRDSLTLDKIMDIIEDPDIKCDLPTYTSKLKLHTLPMTSSMFHLDRAKYIGRYENFSEEYQKLAMMLGLKDFDIPHYKPVGHINKKLKHYKTPPERVDMSQFSSSTLARIRKIFHQDFETFEYEV